MAQDSLKQMWEAQATQQRDLGLDPRHMSPVDKRGVAGDLLQSLHEEVVELGRVSSHYKRHLLASGEPDPDNIADEVADALKLVIALAQLWGLEPEDVAQAFHRKTAVTRAKAEGARVTLRERTKVLCVDMDDVIADLSPWTDELGRLQGNAPPNAKTLTMMEAWKDDWYRSGRFRALAPVSEAPEALREVRSWGWKIVVITARPQWQYKRIYADTLGWLQDHDVPHDLILFNKDKLEAIYEHIVPAWPVAFVEDHERNARHLSRAGVPVLLYDRPHNHDLLPMEGVTRVRGWAEVIEHLEQYK